MDLTHGIAIRPELVNCTELVLVCCHATYVGDGSDTGEDQWVLQPFQRSHPETGKPSEHETYIQHILCGALMVESRPQALLILSGGMTTHSTFTEAEGYEKVLHRLGSRWDAFQRYELENWATDSYQNLLFSVLRFKQVCGRYPTAITVITHAFKVDRFLELHAPAIKWPADRIRVQGINPPFTFQELEETEDGEAERAFDLFVNDPYGVQPSLAKKRRARNWDAHMLADLASQVDPAVAELLYWEGGNTGRDIIPTKLPWEVE
ncbi:hypothetical protein BDY17DRAFT_251277 [Neohortaea acidophila]|uniref:DUF218 domain-containing protein n=1 Tax=Neohortaea acidophila TaxID=245834 RepID=A0A6A6PSB3_9PEZI|nr:uncharacterized protein BDY17DRAFT_251277 [Neohortaea acidophila]KAF2482775.1 hypothetical protein BDY17DRAFT_251277 [Neohortaea acidophila]